MEFDGTPEDLDYNDRVLLIDAMNLFIRNYAAVPAMDDDGNHIGGMLGFLRSLGVAIRSFKPSRVIIVFDGKGGSQRRRKIFPQYKENRKPPVRLNRAYDMTTDEEERENMKYQLVTVVNILEHLPVTVMALDRVEADDVIAHLTNLVTMGGGEAIIYSTDKDFLQLASDRCIVYNPVKKKTYDVALIQHEYGIHPKHFHLFRALDGDKSDNINGVPRVGLKSVLKYIPEFADPSEDVDMALIENKYADAKKVPKMISNILDNKDLVDRNLQLMDLHDGIMSSDAKMKVADRYHKSEIQLDRKGLTEIMMKTRLLSAFPNFNSWLAQNFIPLDKYYNGSET